LQFLRFIKVGEFADGAHEAVKEEHTLLHQKVVLLAHGFLGWYRWHIQAHKAGVEDFAEVVELAEPAEDLEFPEVITPTHLVHVM